MKGGRAVLAQIWSLRFSDGPHTNSAVCLQGRATPETKNGVSSSRVAAHISTCISNCPGPLRRVHVASMSSTS